MPSSKYHPVDVGFVMWSYRVLSGRLKAVCVAVLLLCLVLPIAAHFYLTAYDNASRQSLTNDEKLNELLNNGDGSKAVEILIFRVKELLKIKSSVSNELRDLEKRRQSLLKDIASFSRKVDVQRRLADNGRRLLNELRLNAHSAKLLAEERAATQYEDFKWRHLVLEKGRSNGEAGYKHNVGYNATSEDNAQPHVSISAEKDSACTMDTCFDYTLCPLSSKFPVYFYSPDEFPVPAAPAGGPIPAVSHAPFQSLVDASSRSPHLISEAAGSCAMLTLLPPGVDLVSHAPHRSTAERYLRSLPHWSTNHVVVDVRWTPTTSSSKLNSSQDQHRRDPGRESTRDRAPFTAIRVSPSFSDPPFRPLYDVVCPPTMPSSSSTSTPPPPPISPARRANLLSFAGQYLPFHDSASKPHGLDAAKDTRRGGGGGGKTGESNPNTGYPGDARVLAITTTLKQMSSTFSNPASGGAAAGGNVRPGAFSFEFTCDGLGGVANQAEVGEWAACVRVADEPRSTFTLIIDSDTHPTTLHFQTRLQRALQHGSIPVFLTPRLDVISHLPFSELVDWSSAILYFNPDRVTDLHIVLMSLNDADILAFKHAGRHIYQTYLMSPDQIVNSILATIRKRISIPALPISDVKSVNVFNSSFSPIFDADYIPQDESENSDENLGPIEQPFSSLSFQRNFTSASTTNRVNHKDMNPFSLYPSTPFDPSVVGDAQFIGSSIGFRPIGGGSGGSGFEFSESLGGDSEREQFTIVILTYERTQVLLTAVGRLKSLPYLNSVVIVWNTPEPPLPEIKWPDIGVKVHVIRPPGGANSLNNRFMPYDLIRTDAVLSLDDDAHLRHDEIVFGFRVWREARDRIVGFPGRFHTFDRVNSKFMYDSNYTCQLSMVLTGAAFIHKYYYYQYTDVQPGAIRQMVDRYTNCEDLAMNFLVAHITGKPPIKITSRWTFRCTGCPQTLSSDQLHFEERHACMNQLLSIYGYLPLKQTQFRADSVLFKTRIPSDKQKCFKYV